MASFSEWSNNKMRQATGTAKTTGTPQKVQSFSAWSDQKLGKVDTQKNPASGNTGFDRSGKTRDEYDSSVRQNYAARAAASDKLTESEYNRSTAMQQKYGSYQNYLVGATADGKYYSQPKLGADMERKYNTVTTYEANAKKKAEELQSANETAGNLYTKLNELSGKLPELQRYAGSSAIASGIVQQMQQEYASTLKQYEDATKAVDAAYAAYEPAWNRYKQAAEDYEAYRTEQQNLFDNWKKTIRTDENAINADLTAAQSNVKRLQEQQKALQKQAQQLMNKVSSRRGGTNELMQWSQQAQALQAQAKAMDSQIAEAQGAADLLQEELDWKKYYQYADLTSAEDFGEKSQYKSTANGKKRSNLDILFDNYSDDASGWDDPLYEYINGNSEAGAYITNQAGANYGGDSNPLGALFGMATENRSESQQMTDEEVAIFNYLYASQGKDAAHAYYDYLTGDLNYRQRQEEEAYWRDYAKESPVGSSVFSVLTSPMKGLSYLAQAADYLGTGSIDQNAAYNRFSYANNAIRNQVAETIEQSGNWGQAGSFLYQTGMSMGDFLLNTAITGGFGGGGALSEGMSLAIMGTGAAADATVAAKDRGLTDTQAFTLGTIAGAAEVFTEKFSIEALLKGKWEDGAIKYILKNAFTEGAEEVGSDFINLFADILVAKDKSEWQQTIDAYMAEGKTEGEAFGLAAAQQAAEMGLDFLGGALSGGTMATAGVGIGTVQRNAGYQQTGSTLRKMGDEMVNSIIETAETLDENSEAYKLGQELKNKLNKGKKLTDTEIGRLFAETTRMLEGTEPTAGQTGTAQEQTKGVVLPMAEETGGTVLPTAEQAETQTQQRATEQERQTAPLRETMEAEQPGVLPTAEQAETRQRAARAETETERTGILAGVDEDTIAKVQRIANIVGREVVFFDEGADSAGGMHNGYYNPADGKIYVNARSQNPVAQIISHELTHSIEASGSYSDLQKLVLNRIRQTGVDLQAMRQQKAELYARHGENLTDNAAIDSEIVAEYVEKYLLTDEQSIRAMVQQNRTLGRRILQFINELLAKLGNSDAQERAFLTKAKNYYQSALQETQSSFTADMQQRAAAQAQNMDTLQRQMANGEISEEDAEAAFNDMYDPEIDMQQGLGGLQHSYAGANANGANLESLREAQEMQQAGADMESIRKATGWHEGMDGKWRFEINDSRMQLRADAADIPNYTTLGELVDAPELFEAYPDMADLSVTFHTLEDGQNGGYSRKFDSIELSRDLKNRPEALLNSLIHEAQHAIQNREGFASGANPAYWNRRMENGFDSRTAEERREGARLQEQYEQMRESDPQFVAAMEELNAMAPKVPRGKVDLNTWEQIEPDPPEWVRYDERRDQLEEQYGDRVWDWYSLRDSIDRNARNGGRMPTDLYRDTAGEIEARDTAKRRELTAQERRETSPDYGSEDTVFADSGDGYAIGKTTDNKPFVEVEQDILAGVPEADWVKTVKENLKKKFPNGITVGNNEIQIDGRSRQEMTFSRYMQWLYNNDPQLHTDKLRATDNADEILRATTDWVNEGLNHPRKDRITDFARGNVLLRVGGNDYTADVVVGTKKNGSMALYDVLNLQPTSFTEKEADAAISTNPSPGAARSTASVSDDSVAEKLPPVKKRFSIDEPVERTKDLIAVHNKDWSVIRDAALNWGGIPSPSVAIVDAAEGHTKYGDIIVKSTDIEMDDNGTPDAVYIAFSPEQIKSVTNENPTDNPDIRFSISEGGEYDGAVKLKESTIDTYLRDYAAKSSPKYAKAYIAYMTPDDFLNLTTSEGGRQIVEQHSKELDAEKLGEATRWQPIQLNIDHETGEVQGHEGRHRAVAMRNAGVEQIPVLLFDSSNKYSKSEIGELTLTGQDFGGTWSDAEVRVHNLLPLSYENRDAVVERFTMPTDERTLQYSVTEEETAEATLPTAEDEEKKNSIRTSLPKKAQDYLKRAENALVGRVSRALSVPRFAQREYLQKIVQQISEEYLTTGRVSEETAAELFEQAYSEGIVVDEEFYQQYKDIKDHLRTQAVTISEEDKHDIADFNDFRKSAFGRLRIVNEGGLPVDVAYQELQDMAPELFPDDLTHPADQLVRMFEVAQSIEKTEKSLSEYYGRDAEEFKRWAKNDFDAAIGDTIGDLRTVKRYADERAAKANAAAETPMTTEQVTEAYKQLKKARWESEKAKAKNLLTDHDNVQLGRLLKGEIELEHLDPKTDNVKGITAVYEATTEYERLVKLLTEYKQSQRAKLREEADKFLETANDWKDKKAGILYSRETMERNILDIVKDKKLAQEIIAEYFTPVHEAQAKSTRLKNKMRERVQALNLSTKETKAMQKVGKISEAHAVQLLGEAMDNIRMLENSRGRMAERDGKTLSDWRGIVQEMWKQNPQLDKAKIEHAVEEFRSIYDELFQQMNEARVRNGYEPVNYRSGYFPHFQPGDGDGIMGLFGRALGIDTQVTALPTTINGLTHTFRPGIQWFGNAQQRLGFDTAYDAVEGFDRYIEGVADVIYQTDNIQKLRALATQARYRTGDEGIRKQVDTVYADTRLTEEEKRSKIDSIYEDGRFALSNFVVELEEYTNLLANKKSRADRNMEQALGRNMYNLVKGLESRVAANMVAINPASWLTNFIPLTQGGAMLDRGELLRGMWQTLQSFKENDGIVDASAFLTNRKGSDPLVRTWAQKASATMSSPMEYIDQFTAGSLVRARYNQNLKRGMSETAAMTEADNWTAGVMADRSKGSTPTLFNRSNPMTKVFTQFQLEVNNQLSYLFKDMPRAYKEKGLAALAMALFKFFLGAWLYDEVYEYFIGRRSALDPLGILNDTVGDITGYELPNLVELGVGAVTGDMPSFETEKKNAYDTVTETLGDVAEELPFIGGVLGGGRVPISSALPDWDNLLKTVTSDTWSTKKKLATAGKELMNPLTYLALPFGGGQLKKIYQGLSATIKGGSYSVDAEGNDLLQYPVYNDDPWQAALNAGQAMLFGKTSLKTGRDWVESGFKSFGAKETAAYQGMTEAGVPEEDAYNLLKELRGTKKTETESKAEAERRVLQAADISGDGKSVVYYGLMATDKERELMDALADSDADMGAVTHVLLDVKNAGSLKGAEASNAKRTALAESPLTDDEKREMYRCLFGEKQEDGSYTTSRDDDIMAFEQAGLDFDTFLKVQNEYTTVNEKYSGASEKAVEFSRWVNSQNLAAEQAETVRDCFKYYSQIPAEAARYDSFVSAGLSDDAAYELANSLNALEPEDGKDSVSGLQRYRAVVDAGLSTEEQMNVLGEMMQESEYSKLQTGYSYGVTPEAYVAFRELLPKFDFDGNGTFKQEEVEAAIDSMGGGGNGIVLPGAGGGQSLTVTQQAALWQLANKSWKPAKNPYSTSVGQKVYDALNAETESGIVLPDGTSYTGGLVLPKG